MANFVAEFESRNEEILELLAVHHPINRKQLDPIPLK